MEKEEKEITQVPVRIKAYVKVTELNSKKGKKPLL